MIAICELLLANQRTTSGFVWIPRMTICRLRKAFHTNRTGGFDDLIETGADEEYRLRLGIGDVILDEAFSELRDKNLLSKSDMDELFRTFRDVT